jgi:two-component system chemotaxis response regulator CheY
MTSISDIRLLVVDDNKQMRHLIRVLARVGGIVECNEAETAAEAFAILRARPIDLVIVDWKMQPMDGLTFTRVVRGDPDSTNPYVPILMLTAHTEASRVTAARDAGVTGFLRKPISTRLLFDRISSALTDTRLFIKAPHFFGPDRRHGQMPGYPGPFRRTDDRGVMDVFDIEDVQCTA